MLDPDFAREQYRFELQRKNEIFNAVSLPVGVLSVLGGLVVLMAKGFSYGSWLRIPFCLCMLANAIWFMVATWSLVRAYVGSKYASIPKPGMIESFKAALEEFYVGMGYPPERADPDFREQLTRWYVDTTDRNSANNDRRSRHLDRAAKGLIGVLVSMALCGILYVVDALRVL